MAYGVLVPTSIVSKHIDAWQRNVVDADSIEQGSVLVMGGRSATAGEDEVFDISKPATGSLTNLWMAYSGDEMVLSALKYRGLDPDPRNFINKAGDVFSAYRPQLFDIIKVNADALSGTYITSTTTHVNATDANWQLVWGNSQTASVLSYKLLAVSYMSLADGGINDQRITAYLLECVGL